MTSRFSSLLLLSAACLALTSGPSAARGPAAEVVGIWRTEWGALQMWERGSTVLGAYPLSEGRIEGTYNPKTRELSGVWIQNGGATKCATPVQGSHTWGRFAFSFDSTGRTFQGRWSNCDGELGGGWNGTR